MYFIDKFSACASYSISVLFIIVEQLLIVLMLDSGVTDKYMKNVCK